MTQIVVDTNFVQNRFQPWKILKKMKVFRGVPPNLAIHNIRIFRISEYRKRLRQFLPALLLHSGKEVGWSFEGSYFRGRRWVLKNSLRIPNSRNISILQLIFPPPSRHNRKLCEFANDHYYYYYWNRLVKATRKPQAFDFPSIFFLNLKNSYLYWFVHCLRRSGFSIPSPHRPSLLTFALWKKPVLKF